MSPGIPVFRTVVAHIKPQHNPILSRGTAHTSPGKDADVRKLMDIIVEEEWFSYERGRAIARSVDKPDDVVIKGLISVDEGAMDRWWDNRNFTRRTSNTGLTTQNGGQ
ncbi:hypothetical protein BC834DRAFT_471446 [Gloeopeniophorella convolvens]|nr:hypothetical protein BC834DRAFT_471446 [Gloeopeniophorella convolvens]